MPQSGVDKASANFPVQIIAGLWVLGANEMFKASCFHQRSNEAWTHGASVEIRLLPP